MHALENSEIQCESCVPLSHLFEIFESLYQQYLSCCILHKNDKDSSIFAKYKQKNTILSWYIKIIYVILSTPMLAIVLCAPNWARQHKWSFYIQIWSSLLALNCGCKRSPIISLTTQSLVSRAQAGSYGDRFINKIPLCFMLSSPLLIRSQMPCL